MTTTKTPQRTTPKPFLLTGTGLVTLALLTGCTGSGDDAGTPTPQEATTSAAAPETSPAAGQTSPTTGDGTATASPTATGDTTSPTATDPAATGDTDAVFAAIGAVLSEHSEGVITAIDREDDRDEYEMDLVVGNEVIEVSVLEDGTVREDDRDSDDEDDIREAQQAEVTAEDAVRTALEGRDGQILDEAELDEDSGSLHWEIELNRTEGGDGDHLSVDAMTGEIAQR